MENNFNIILSSRTRLKNLIIDPYNLLLHHIPTITRGELWLDNARKQNQPTAKHHDNTYRYQHRPFSLRQPTNHETFRLQTQHFRTTQMVSKKVRPPKRKHYSRAAGEISFKFSHDGITEFGSEAAAGKLCKHISCPTKTPKAGPDWFIGNVEVYRQLN